MKKIINVFSIILVILMVIPVDSVLAESDSRGVDDLRGRWDVNWLIEGNEENPPPPLIMYINDLAMDPDDPTKVYANGCMRSPDSNMFAPLSLWGGVTPEGLYDVMIISTVIPDGWDPFMIRFNGIIHTFGNGVADDDVAEGTLMTGFARGDWEARHHDRRKTKCPSVSDANLEFSADVYAHRDIAYQTPNDTTILEAYTVIVSSGMHVAFPDGREKIVAPYTDIFSPDVDFEGRFRYLIDVEETPIPGELYIFTLLDVFGNPIEGAVSTDFWTGCEPQAPSNLDALYDFEDHIDLSWDAVPYVPGVPDPDPDNLKGSYHLTIQPHESWGMEYGSGQGWSPFHWIPWNYFDPGSEGVPDGYDFGVGVGFLGDGPYVVSVAGVQSHLWDEEAAGHECFTFDRSENLIMNKQGSELNFTQPAVLSGHVYEEDGGGPLEDIRVDVCLKEGDECRSSETDGNGFYKVFDIFPGEYIVQVWDQPPWKSELFDNQFEFESAAVFDLYEGDEVTDVDFELALARSISGRVTDESTGLGIEGILVDACDYDEILGYCRSAETDQEGYYIIEDLFDMDFRVQVWDQNPWMNEYYLNTMNWEEAVRVPADSIDVDFQLVEGGSISGTVYEEIEVEGELILSPLSGLHVDACQYSDEPQYCMGADTDELGQYEISGLPADDFRVFIWGQPGWTGQLYSLQTDWALAYPVTVTPGILVSGIDFVLQPGGSITGEVVDQDGLPLEGIGVDLLDGGYGTCTNEFGEYALEGIPYGNHIVAAGRDFCGVEGYIEAYSEEILLDESTPEVGEVDFILSKGGEISGIASDESGPLANIGVDTLDGGYGTCTNEFGEYTIQGLPQGTHVIAAGRDFCGVGGYLEAYSLEITLDSETPSVGDVNFDLVQGGSISGFVIEEGTDPQIGLGGLHVESCEYADEPAYCMGTETNGDGSYQITGLPSGAYRVYVVEQPGWGNEFYFNTPDWHEAVEVIVSAGVETTGIDFGLIPVGSISGRITDLDTGLGIANVHVDIDEGGYGICTDAEGNYMMTSVPFGIYSVVAGRPHCENVAYEENWVEDIDLNASTTPVEGVDIQLAP
ncbi:MAG: carboxypeptidase regulatory-like domain-containing protein [Anaerolineaceae bacterium]|nr:carboxypeptidase regulatory-like domain-containing protein [Anaerolineaceae bacterium]